MLQLCQENILLDLAGVHLRRALHRNIDHLPLDVHQVPSELEVGEDGRQFVVGHLHVLLMVLHLVLVSDVRVEFPECPAVAMGDEDHLSA